MTAFVVALGNTTVCRYKSDIALMQQLGLKHLRLSISWSRLLPGGRKGSAVNGEAVKFYGSVLDTLTAAGESDVGTHATCAG